MCTEANRYSSINDIKEAPLRLGTFKSIQTCISPLCKYTKIDLSRKKMNRSDPNGLNWTKWNKVDKMDRIRPNRNKGD